MELLAKLGPWNWFILAVMLFALEMVVPGVHFLWFGISAIIVGLLGLATGFVWQWQVIAFALVSVASVFFVRRWAQPANIATDDPSLNIRGAQYIGRRVWVEEAIANGRGRVRVGDTVWGAQGEDAPKGAIVEVTGVNGTVLVVANPDEAD